MARLGNNTESYGGFSYSTTDDLFSGLDTFEAQQYAKALESSDSSGYALAFGSPDVSGYLQTDTVEDFINSVLESKGFSGEIELGDENNSLSQNEFKETLAIVEELIGNDVFAIVGQDDLPEDFDANAITQTVEQDPYGLGLETEKSTYTDGDNKYSYAQPYKESASDIANVIQAKLIADGVSSDVVDRLNINGIISSILQDSNSGSNSGNANNQNNSINNNNTILQQDRNDTITPEELADIIEAIQNQLPDEYSEIFRKTEMIDNSGDDSGDGDNEEEPESTEDENTELA